MTRAHRLLFLGEGSSDRGVMIHIERIAEECGVPVVVTAPDLDRLSFEDRTIAGKLATVQKLGGAYDLLVIHRDTDRSTREARVAEIRAAVEKVMPKVPWVPVVPCRMTEAWLVLDERLIREVAGNPNGRVALQLPTAGEAERLSDPKALLKDLLVTASELTGRRRRMFQVSFPFHRKLILERTGPGGPISQLPSWQAFTRDLRAVLEVL
jgi:hypothetical protein